MLIVVTVGSILPLLSRSMVVLLFSGLLFGSAFLSVIAAMTQLIRRTLPPARWAAGIAVSTSLFALGQAAGPLLVGFLADRSGGLTGGLVVSALFLALAAGLAGGQRAVPT